MPALFPLDMMTSHLLPNQSSMPNISLSQSREAALAAAAAAAAALNGTAALGSGPLASEPELRARLALQYRLPFAPLPYYPLPTCKYRVPLVTPSTGRDVSFVYP